MTKSSETFKRRKALKRSFWRAFPDLTQEEKTRLWRIVQQEMVYAYGSGYQRGFQTGRIR